MRTLLLFLLVLPHVLFGQTFYEDTSIPIDFSYSREISVLGVTDSTFIFSNADKVMVMANQNGALLWQRKFEVEPWGDLDCHDLIATSDTTFCVPFFNTSVITDDGGGLLIFDKTGTYVSAKSYTLTGGLHRVQKAGNDQLILIGAEPFNGLESYLSVTKTDLNGNILVSKKVISAASNHIPTILGLTFLKVNPNLFILTFNDYELPFINDYKGITTLTMDSSLNVVWSNVLNADSVDNPVAGILSGNRYFLVSSTRSFGLASQSMMLTCMDFSGAVIWNKLYEKAGYEIWPEDISFDSDSTLIVSGYLKTLAGNEEGIVIKLDQSGHCLVGNKYAHPFIYPNLRVRRAFHFNGSMYGLYSAGSGSNYFMGLMRMNHNNAVSCQNETIFFDERTVTPPLNPYPLLITDIFPVTYSYPSNSFVTSTSYAINNSCINNCSTIAYIKTPENERVCMGTTLTFSSASFNYISLSWLIDGVSSGNLDTCSFSFNNPGIHLVELIANGSICSDTSKIFITVDSLPVCDFTVTQQNLSGRFVNLSSNNESNQWLLGDHTEFSSQNLTHYFQNTGTYNNCLIVSNTCGSDSLCKTFYADDYSNFAFNCLNGDYTSQWGIGICQNPKGNLVVRTTNSLIELNKEGEIVRQVARPSIIGPSKLSSLGSIGYLTSQNGSISVFDTSFNQGIEFSASLITLNNICASNDSTYYVVATPQVSAGLVIKLDKHLNMIWAKRIATPKNLLACAVSKDNNLLLMGKAISLNLYLSKLDLTTGELIWSKKYYQYGGIEGYDMILDSSDNIYITGDSYPPSVNGQHRSFIIKTDSSGVPLWKKSYYHIDGLSNSNGRFCGLNRYGELFLVHSSSYSGILATKLDTSGNIKWSYNYPLDTLHIFFSAVGSAICMDGGLAMTGSAYTTSNSNDVYVMKIDSSGTTNSCNYSVAQILQDTIIVSVTDNLLDSVTNYSLTYVDQPNVSNQTLSYPHQIICSENSCSDFVDFNYVRNDLTFNFSQNYTEFPDITWDFGDGTTSPAQNPVHTYTGPGVYHVCLSATIPGCGYQTQCHTINFTPTSVSVSSDTTICLNSCASVLANASGGATPYVYSWFPDIGNGPGPYSVCPSSTTLYTVHVTDDENVSVSDSITVIVYPTTNLTVSGSLSIIEGDSTSLTITGVPISSWMPCNYLTTCSGNSVIAFPPVTTTYTFEGTDLNGCTVMNSITITVDTVAQMISTSNHSWFYIAVYPNPFGDKFMIKFSSAYREPISLRIYDMTGRLVDNFAEIKQNDLFGDKLTSGLYLLEAKQEERVYRLRLVKQ
jgi:PKD repeat protein